jgi:cytochrome c peroxidase
MSPAVSPSSTPSLRAVFRLACALLAAAPLRAAEVPAGEPVSPFLPAGPLTATWTGAVHVDLRSDYHLEADLRGRVEVSLNGTNVYTAEAGGARAATSKRVRFNKGDNPLVVTFSAPAAGDAWLRLYWKDSETPAHPVPAAVFRPPAAPPALAEAEARHRGRALFLEHRCVDCHKISAAAGVPELAMDAPAFIGIGSRRNADWLARWIADPQALRPGTPMPKMLHGPAAADDARALAAWLGTLKAEEPPPAPTTGDAEAGRAVFEKLHCAACHVEPGRPATPGKVSFEHVNAKFTGGALEAFLRNPQEHFAWIRMPDFQFTAGEVADLAAWLRGQAAPAPAPPADPGRAVVARGRELAQELGCINCHAAPLPTKHRARPLAELPAGAWTRGCVADTRAADSPAPEFAFTAADRAALRAFGATDRKSLERHVPQEFAARHAELLGCRGCHGQFEGFPRFEVMGGKLQPEWAAKFIAGLVDYQPRPWLAARMPAFPAYAAPLAAGLAHDHGFPARTPAPPAIREADAEIGRKLVSSDGGFACITCHAVGDFGATAVFEAPGPNLIHGGERLLPEFFHRWLQNPHAIQPDTKMPRYFDGEGKSPLPDYDGDGDRTIDAMWQYLRQGRAMQPPGPQP